MKTLLYLQTSPRKERSKSAMVADQFIETYQKVNPNDRIEKSNVFEMDLPPFNGDALNAKYAILNGQEHTPEQAKAWRVVEACIEKFKTADKLLLTVPMWNFGIPYKLKHYIDIITQPGYTFAFDPDSGYQGLVLDKPALVVYSRGGNIPPEQEPFIDYQKRYIESWLGFIGFKQIYSLLVQPTLAEGPEIANEKIQSAIKEANDIASTF